VRSDGSGARADELIASVNLLPEEVGAERRVRRRAALSVVGVVVFVAALAGLYVHKLGQVNDAEAARDEAAVEVADLEQQVAQLQPFRELADRLNARNAILASAMSREISYARALNDVALAFPASASLQSLEISLTSPEDSGDGVINFGTPVANVTYSGYSTERYAPGVETVLVEFDRVSPLFNVRLSTAATEERGSTEVTNFDGTAAMSESARTGRYVNGLPPEVAP
jgi:hypothetical protein